MNNNGVDFFNSFVVLQKAVQSSSPALLEVPEMSAVAAVALAVALRRPE